MKLFVIMGFFMVLSIPGFFISDAFAYIDPGTGSMLIQALVGALVGIAIALKIYWYKLKEKIFGNSQKD